MGQIRGMEEDFRRHDKKMEELQQRSNAKVRYDRGP
jgi:hypothetical protein